MIYKGDFRFQRLKLESYFIAKGFVTLTLEQFRKLPASYAKHLYIAMLEYDKMAKEAAEARSRSK